jgi:cytochrome c biogenesis protein CcdA
MKAKLSKVCDTIFSYGMLLALFVAFVLFLGFVVSFFVGHDAAAQITTFLYKTLLPKTYIFSVIVSLIGLIGMYLRGEKAMMMNSKPKKKAE